jgi:hypothetical protein
VTKDVVNDVGDRCGGVDWDAVLRNILLRLMPPHDSFAFHSFSVTPLIVRSSVKPPVQCIEVDIKDEHAVEQAYELREVAGTTTEKRRRVSLVGDQGFHFVYMPEMVFVRGDIPRFPRFRIAYVSEFAVTMNGMVAAPLQFVADRSLAGAGKTFDQVVPRAHSWNLQRRCLEGVSETALRDETRPADGVRPVTDHRHAVGIAPYAGVPRCGVTRSPADARTAVCNGGGTSENPDHLARRQTKPNHGPPRGATVVTKACRAGWLVAVPG